MIKVISRESINKRMKKRFKKAYDFIKPYISLILLLYLIPLVDMVFLFCYLSKDFSAMSVLLFLLQFTSLISATTASVAASLLFYKNHKDVEKIQTNRIIIVVLSLSFHLIIELLLLKEDFNLVAKYVLSFMLLFASLILLSFVIKYYKSIDDYRKDIDEFANKVITSEEMKRIKTTENGIVDGDEYNLEG